MENFSEILTRLKHSLRVSKDGEVAELLGMSRTAFGERKRRESFPTSELFALKVRRPDLDIDATYVLTGVREQGPIRQMTDQFVSAPSGLNIPGLTESIAGSLQRVAQLAVARQRYVDLFAHHMQYCSDGQIEKILGLMIELKGPGPTSVADLAPRPTAAMSSRVSKVEQDFGNARIGQVVGKHSKMATSHMTVHLGTRGEDSPPKAPASRGKKAKG